LTAIQVYKFASTRISKAGTITCPVSGRRRLVYDLTTSSQPNLRRHNMQVISEAVSATPKPTERC
jgi:hypothetical protein